ncbi:MAG: AAA family ATPase [Pseudomonadota bacterium]|nr:AAA family ATPase [Pseudomonadota bacterium]
MKILELKLKNLNSLYGEWTIDFTDPEYTANGIFALTGPTGSGKSTILDAICLALYGATPRLGRITKSSNEIMSRQTGECYAEVVFECQSGQYRCHWEQRRARKSPDGNLQDQEHTIGYAYGEQKIIESKKSKVLGVIEDKTGMDFDRFTRSILLAQGSFDTFLKADTEDKSRILEQITGTEIYTDISRRVHERHREEMEALKVLEGDLAGIKLLEPEALEAIQTELQQKQTQSQELNQSRIQFEKGIQWLQQIEQVGQHLQAIRQSQVELQAKQDAFKPDQIRLDKALEVASLDGDYATLKGLQQQQTKEQQALLDDQQKLPDQKKLVAQHQADYDQTQQQLQAAKSALQTQSPVLKQVRALDIQIQNQQAALSKSQQQQGLVQQQIQQKNQTIEQQQIMIDQQHNALADIGRYLEGHQQDEWLVTGLAGVEAQLQQLVSYGSQAHQLKKALEDLAEKSKSDKSPQALTLHVQAELDKVISQQKTLQLDDDALQSKKEALLQGKLLREYHAERDSAFREMTLVRKIESLEEERLHLVDGQPCPLCGAEDHPYAADVPVSNALEDKIQKLDALIGQVDALEAERVELQQKKEKLSEQAYGLQQQLVQLEFDIKQLASETTRIEQQQHELQEYIDTLKVKLQEQLKDHLQDDISNPQAVLQALKAKAAQWQVQQKALHEAEKQLAQLQANQKEAAASQGPLEAQLHELAESVQQLEKSISQQQEQRFELFGEQNPDNIESQLQADIEKAEKSLQALQGVLQQSQQVLSGLLQQIDYYKQQIAARAPELQQLQQAFEKALDAFELDESGYLQARLAPPERAALQEQARKLQQQQIALDSKAHDRTAELVQLKEQQLTDRSMDLIRADLADTQNKQQILVENISELNLQIKQHEEALIQVAARKDAIDSQKIECDRWTKLHELIGSADGKKFRNFAQGLTFELMVAQANKQLAKMSDRYVLTRSIAAPLELNVIDQYQAGDIRSTKNLSGGESFIVSLTLALGLSKMSSRKVRVDSLFLDEGFGTLDEDTLDTALDVLSSLHQEGKVIGIISHISALKERIRTQVQVMPGFAGKSVLNGPGCSAAV